MPGFKDLKCTTKLYLQVAILWPYDTHAKYQLVKCSGIHRKKNFEIVFEFKSDKAVLTFSFHFLSFPLLSLFLPFFYSLAGHLEGFILVGKVFGKAFTILGLDERKGRRVVKQGFHRNFGVNVTWFSALFPGLLD